MIASVFQPDSMSRLFAAVGLALVVVALIALVGAHLRAPELSPVRDAVSRYGISPAAAYYRVQTIAMALAAVALIVSIADCFHGVLIGPTLVCLALFALSRAAISWYPMDEPGTAPTSHGAAHGILAIVAFVSVGLAANRFRSILNVTPVDSWWRDVSGALSWAILITVVAMLFTRTSGSRRYFGLIERLFYGAYAAWLLVACGGCAFLAASR